MMKRHVIVLWITVMIMVIASCGIISYHHTSTGAEITDQQLQQIKPGMTTDDVIVILGTPAEIKKLSDGRKVYVYRWQRGSRTEFLWGTLGTSGAKAYHVTIIFDREGKVLKIGKGAGGPAEITPTIKIKQEKETTPSPQPAL